MIKTYFSENYFQDLNNFAKLCGKEVPNCGPFYYLCGLSITPLFDHRYVNLYVNREKFIVCLYVLNLINQGLYSFDMDALHVWLAHSPPFVDSRGCTSAHGGLGGNPFSIIPFARKSSYIPNSESIDVNNDLLSNGLNYFLREQLTDALVPMGKEFQFFDDFEKSLRRDIDCSEVGYFLPKANA